MKKWIPVLESDSDGGRHTCYVRHFNSAKYIWLTQRPDGFWQVEVRPEASNDFFTIAKSKSLEGAKHRALRFMNDMNKVLADKGEKI